MDAAKPSSYLREMAVHRESTSRLPVSTRDDRIETTLLGAALIFDDVALLETLLAMGQSLDVACTVSGKTARQLAKERKETDTGKLIFPPTKKKPKKKKYGNEDDSGDEWLKGDW